MLDAHERVHPRVFDQETKEMKLTKASRYLFFATAIALAVGSVQAQAPNIENLKQMKVSGVDPSMPPVPQEGKNAAQLRENLKRVKLPAGFKIDLYAVVPDARHMAVAPSTNMLFVGTRKNTVWAVTNRNSGETATEVKPFAPSAKFHVPHKTCTLVAVCANG